MYLNCLHAPRIGPRHSHMTLSELEVGEEHLVATLLASLISTGSLWLLKAVVGGRGRSQRRAGSSLARRRLCSAGLLEAFLCPLSPIQGPRSLPQLFEVEKLQGPQSPFSSLCQSLAPKSSRGSCINQGLGGAGRQQNMHLSIGNFGSSPSQFWSEDGL